MLSSVLCQWTIEFEIKSVQDCTSTAGVTRELEVTNLQKNTIVTSY